MLRIYNKNHSAIGYIQNYKDLKIECDVRTGDKTLYFTYLGNKVEENPQPVQAFTDAQEQILTDTNQEVYCAGIEEPGYEALVPECYVETREDEYVIKEKNPSSDGFPQYVAILNLEDLRKKRFATFSVEEATIEEAARLALAGTGWIVGECTVTKRRNAGMVNVTPKDAIDKLCTAFMCEKIFDTKKKTVSFYPEVGSDKGVYFLRSLNMRKLSKQSDTYDYYTRIIPTGKKGLTIESVNDGKNYLDNFQYSDKIITYFWEGESYTDAQALKDDAELMLDSISKPVASYSADVIDLAKQSGKYNVLSYGIGDTIKLIDVELGIREKQRIMKMTQYPDEPWKNTCELGNPILTFEEMQQRYQEASEIINNMIAGDGRYKGKIDVSNILNFEGGIAGSNTVSGIISGVDGIGQNLAELKLTVGTIEANYLSAEQADIKYAKLERLEAAEITLKRIEGDYANFKSTITEELSAQVAIIDNLTGDLATFKKTVTDELVVAKGWMEEASIGSAQIASVSANKVTSGTIDTAVVTVAGTDGRLRIADNTIHISDAKQVRVQIGKDTSGDYSMSVWDAQGKLIWDALGATEDTIQRPIIHDDVIANDANISGRKLNIKSVVTEINDGETKISGTTIEIDGVSLSVRIEEQSQKIENSESYMREELNTQKAEIESNKQSIALRVTTQEYEKYKTETEGKLTASESRLSASESSIKVLQEKIALKVEQTDIEQAMKEVDGKLEAYSTTGQMNAAIELAKNSIVTEVSETYTTKREFEDVSGKITSLETWKVEASQKITKEGIITTVGNYYAYDTDLQLAEKKIESVETQATQTANKFSWLVKSGTSETNFVITDRLAELTADYINLHGSITIDGIGKAEMEKLVHGDLIYTKEKQIFALTDDGVTIFTDSNDETYVDQADIFHFSSAAGGAGWGYFAGKQLSVPEFTANLYLDEIGKGNGYLVLRQGVAYAVWKEETWYAKKADGSGNVLKWTWKSSTDAVIAEYQKDDNCVVTCTAYVPFRTYQEIKMPEMVASWAAGAIDEFTQINGGLIMTHTIVAESLAAGAVTAEKLDVNAVKSKNYVAGQYGSFLNLADGSFISKNLSWDIYGNLVANNGKFTGEIEALTGSIGSYTIKDGGIKSIKKIPTISTDDGVFGPYEEYVDIGIDHIEFAYINYGEPETSYDVTKRISIWARNGIMFCGEDGMASTGITSYEVFTTNVRADRVIQTSDERLKDIHIWEEKIDDMLMEIEPIVFSWVDGDNSTNFGISAQKTERLMQKYGFRNNGLVHYDEKRDRYAIAYSELHALEIYSIQENRKRILKNQHAIENLQTRTEKAELDYLDLKQENVELREESHRNQKSQEILENMLRDLIQQVAKLSDKVNQASA